jgi:hypothetical protein
MAYFNNDSAAPGIDGNGEGSFGFQGFIIS